MCAFIDHLGFLCFSNYLPVLLGIFSRCRRTECCTSELQQRVRIYPLLLAVHEELLSDVHVDSVGCVGSVRRCSEPSLVWKVRLRQLTKQHKRRSLQSVYQLAFELQRNTSDRHRPPLCTQ